jgi:hypothetical protein
LREFGRECRQPIDRTMRPPRLEHQIAALDPAEFAQRGLLCIEQVLGGARRADAEPADAKPPTFGLRSGDGRHQ